MRKRAVQVARNAGTARMVPRDALARLPNRETISMSEPIERNLGEQPIAKLLTEHELSTHDLVAASTEQITHKMVTKACKGRRLTPNVQQKIRHALNRAAGTDYALADLFNYQ
jgi:hypothetical protein